MFAACSKFRQVCCQYFFLVASQFGRPWGFAAFVRRIGGLGAVSALSDGVVRRVIAGGLAAVVSVAGLTMTQAATAVATASPGSAFSSAEAFSLASRSGARRRDHVDALADRPGCQPRAHLDMSHPGPPTCSSGLMPWDYPWAISVTATTRGRVNEDLWRFWKYLRSSLGNLVIPYRKASC